MIFRCHICDGDFPDIHKHTHHIKPRSLGGTDDPSNLVELCPGCHDALHAIAYKLASKKASPSRIQDQVSIIYKTNIEAQKKCFKLASLVREAILSSAEVEQDPNSLQSVSTVLTKRQKDLVRVFCLDQKISQERFFQQALLKMLKEIYPDKVNNLENEIKSIKWAKKR